MSDNTAELVEPTPHEVGPRAAVSRTVSADPLDLFHWIADVTRMPEWDPSVRRAEWLGRGPMTGAGALFVRRPRSRFLRRSQPCKISVAEPGRELVFRTLAPAGGSAVAWRFRFHPVPGGTRLRYDGTHRALARGDDGIAEDRAALERIAALWEGRATVRQPQLGQVHTAEGPLDLSAMFVMHHGFRRDLRDLSATVPVTPLTDAEAWGALNRRWRGMSTALHHHHRVEDDSLWPPLLERVGVVGDTEAATVLRAMESEHSRLDPLVAACAAGFAAMAAAPDVELRDRLVHDLAEMRDVLLEHLAHEETDALPLAQRHLSVSAWDAFGAAARKEYGLSDIGFAVPWSTLGIPREEFDVAYAHGGTLVRAILALTRRRFEHEHRLAFRHRPAQGRVG
jgi:hypothetical protein